MGMVPLGCKFQLFEIKLSTKQCSAPPHLRGRRFFMRRAFLRTQQKCAPTFITGAVHASQLQNFLRTDCRNALIHAFAFFRCRQELYCGETALRTYPRRTSPLPPVRSEKEHGSFRRKNGHSFVRCLLLSWIYGESRRVTLRGGVCCVEFFKKIFRGPPLLVCFCEKQLPWRQNPFFRNKRGRKGRKTSRAAVFRVRFAVRATALCGRLFRISAFFWKLCYKKLRKQAVVHKFLCNAWNLHGIILHKGRCRYVLHIGSVDRCSHLSEKFAFIVSRET